MNHNPYVNVDVRLSVQKVLDPNNPDDMELAIDELAGDRCGYFKLESSYPMEPSVALEVYRSRVAVEHLISSIKSVVKLKPMRVWKDSSVNRALLMALISQLIVSLTIVDMKGAETKKNVHGKMVIKTVKPAPVTVVRSLGQLTVTYISSGGKVKNRIFSNFDPINTEVMGILDRIEQFPSGKIWKKRQLSIDISTKIFRKVWLGAFDS